jgi:predicted ester cyclase|tara:strand:- start:254 stop:1111 length:858 start_codon:yes stop_codon:yes gene_type:complete
MVYKSVSVVFVIAVVVIFMAAHHEKGNDDLASLKEAHNLHWEGWKSADMETHFSTVYPEGSGIFPDGYLASSMKNLDYDSLRNSAKQWYENFEVQIGNPNFNIQGNVAVGTYNQTTTNKETGREEKSIRTDVWARTGGKWLRFHFQYTPLTADNVVMTNRFIEEAWNKGDLSVLDELCDPDIVMEQTQAVVSWRAAFPDYHLTVDEISAGNNKVTVEWTITGTHQGEFMGVAATGKKVKYSGIGVTTFAGGKLSKISVASDFLNLWRQLGVDPPQPPAADSSVAE